MQMSHVPYDAMGSTRSSTPHADMIFYLWKMCRLAMFCACLLFAVLLSMTYGLNRATGEASLSLAKNNSIHYSPLQSLFNKDQPMAGELQESDSAMLQKITQYSTLEFKTLVIAETVVPYEDREKLYNYVKQQLDASNVISEAQKCAVLTMVNLAPIEGSVHQEDIGEMGSLRNSVVMALIKQHLNNVHFMLIGVRAEPRLGWRWLAYSERNAWNGVLSRALNDKVRTEANNNLWHREVHELHNSPNHVPVITLDEIIHEGAEF